MKDHRLEGLVAVTAIALGVVALAVGGVALQSTDEVAIGSPVTWTIGVLVILGVVAAGYGLGTHVVESDRGEDGATVPVRFDRWSQVALWVVVGASLTTASGSRLVFGLGDPDAGVLMIFGAVASAFAWVLDRGVLMKRARQERTKSTSDVRLS